MNAIPNSFLQGAGFIKKNQAIFKADCAEMASLVTNDSVRSQLIAASKAGYSKANTGLSESGWRAFAEIIGMCSPSSSKLVIPADTTPSQHKQDVMGYWLVHGVYTSSRVDGKGGSVAIKDKAVLYTLGLTDKKDKQLKQANIALRQVPDISQDLEEVGFD